MLSFAGAINTVTTRSKRKILEEEAFIHAAKMIKFEQKELKRMQAAEQKRIKKAYQELIIKIDENLEDMNDRRNSDYRKISETKISFSFTIVAFFISVFCVIGTNIKLNYFFKESKTDISTFVNPFLIKLSFSAAL